MTNNASNEGLKSKKPTNDNCAVLLCCGVIWMASESFVAMLKHPGSKNSKSPQIYVRTLPGGLACGLAC